MNRMKQIVNMIGSIILVQVQIIIVPEKNSVFGHVASKGATATC